MPWTLVKDEQAAPTAGGHWELAPIEGEQATPQAMPPVPSPSESITPPGEDPGFDFPTAFQTKQAASDVGQAAAQEGKSLLGGAFRASQSMAHLLNKGSDLAASAASKITGKPADQFKSKFMAQIEQDAGHYADKFQKEGMQGLIGDLLGAAPQAGMDIAAISVLGPAGLPVYGGLQGAAEGGLKGAALGAAQGALTHGTLKALGSLPTKEALALAGGAGAVTTPGGAKEKLRGGLELAGLQAMGGGAGEKGPGIGRLAKENLELLNPQLDMGIISPESRVLGKIISKVVSPEKREAAYQNVVNQYASIENIYKKALKLGMKIKPGENPLYLSRDYLSVSGKVAEMVKNGTYEIDENGHIKVTGEGMEPVLRDYEQATPEKDPTKARDDLNKFMEATRTVEDLARVSEKVVAPDSIQDAGAFIPASPIAPQGMFLDYSKLMPKTVRRMNKSGMPVVTDEQIVAARQSLDELNAKYGDKISALKDAGDRLNDFQHRVLQMKVSAGLLSQGEADRMIALNPHHIPFDRMHGEGEENAGVITAGEKKAGGIFRKGAAQEKTIQGSDLDIHDPLGSMYRHLFLIEDACERNKIARSMAQFADNPATQSFGIARVENGDNPNTVAYFDNGVKKYLQVTPNIYSAMRSMNEMQSKFVLKALSMPKHWLQVGATITPEFMLKNPIRDNIDAYVYSRTGFRPYIDIPGALADIAGRSDIYQEYLRSGSAYSGVVHLSRHELQKTYANLLKNKSLLSRLDIIADAKDLSEAMEQATRLAAYKSARRSGRSEIESAYHAAEATVDFRVKGSGKTMGLLNSTIPFLNAGIQGVDRTRRAFATDPKGATLKALAAITVPSVILHAVNKDNPDYKELPAWDKYLFWHIPTDNGSFIRVPKPFLLGQLFGSAPEAFLDYLHTKDPQALKDMVGQLGQAVSPVSGDVTTGLLPAAFKPLLENVTNKSFFRDAPIVPQTRETMPKAEQYGRYTSETAKVIGRKINQSPAKIDNLVTGYFGGSGRYALQASDLLAARAIEKVLGQKPIGGERGSVKDLSNWPVLRGFLSRPVYAMQSTSLQRFYENAKDVSGWYKSFREKIDSGDIESARDVKNRHPEIRFVDSFNSAIKEFGDRRRTMDVVMSNKSMTDKQKRQVLTDLAHKTIEQAKMLNGWLKNGPDAQ